MQFSESQSRFLDTVQGALRRYDAQLKDINQKVCLAYITLTTE